MRHLIRERIRINDEEESYVEREKNNFVVTFYTREAFKIEPDISEGSVSTHLYSNPVYYKKEGVWSQSNVIRFRFEINNAVVSVVCRPLRSKPVSFKVFIDKREVSRGQGKIKECVTTINKILIEKGVR